MKLTECKSTSPQEALQRFEEAVMDRALGSVGMSYNNLPEIEKEYQEAKAELLIWMSHIP